MKKIIQFLSAVVITISSWQTLQAENVSTTLPNSVHCTKEELMRFFPEQIVESILIKGEIPSDQAKKIAYELSRKDQELAKLVETRSAKLDTHSLKTATQRDVAIKIYRETLFEVFAKVLKENGITDDDRIQALLDDLQEERSKLFIECIRKQSSS